MRGCGTGPAPGGVRPEGNLLAGRKGARKYWPAFWRTAELEINCDNVTPLGQVLVCHAETMPLPMTVTHKQGQQRTVSSWASLLYGQQTGLLHKQTTHGQLYRSTTIY